MQLCRCLYLYFRPPLNPPKCVFTRVDICFSLQPRAPTALQVPSARDSYTPEVNAVRPISAGAATPVAPRRILVAHWPACAALIAVPWLQEYQEYRVLATCRTATIPSHTGLRPRLRLSHRAQRVPTAHQNSHSISGYGSNTSSTSDRRAREAGAL